MDDRIVKVKVDRCIGGGQPLYPWAILRHLPDCPCVFDSYRGTVGFDVFPFAITTRINASSEVFLKVYEESETD